MEKENHILSIRIWFSFLVLLNLEHHLIQLSRKRALDIVTLLSLVWDLDRL